MRKRPLFLSLLVLLALGGGLGWRLWGQAPETAPPLLAEARLGTVRQTVLASGMIEAKELVSVGARVSGQIQNLAVALGDEVTAGQLIAEIDSADQQNELLQSKAALAGILAQITAKKAGLERAELALSRQERLGAQSLTLRDTLEGAKAEVQILRADLLALETQKASAEVKVQSSEVELARTRITAPISGTVVAVVVKEGQTVNAMQSAPTIVKIANLATMVVKAEISEADVMHVAAGQRVSFTTLGAPNRPFRAVVRGVEPAPTALETADTISSETAIYYNGLLEVDNPDRQLRIGMSAEVTIELARAENVVTVPASAVKRDREGSYVEIYDPATQGGIRRPVTIGLTDKVMTEVREGLAEGENVISGSRIAPARGGSGGAGMRGPRMF